MRDVRGRIVKSLSQAPTTEPTSPDIPRRMPLLTNKQVKVETLDPSGNPVSTAGEYSYDGDGRRIKKHVPSTGEVTVFVYDAAGKLIGEYSTIAAPQSPMGEHNFSENGVNYVERDKQEEFRTSGLGYNQRGDITENKLRKELGYRPRAAYNPRIKWELRK